MHKRKVIGLLGTTWAVAVVLSLPAMAAAPTGYQEEQIGALDQPGTTTVDASGKWTIDGAVGTDVAGAEDNLYFVYKTLNGNGSVTARQVARYSDTGGGSPNSGVMIRESLAPGAAWSGLLFTTSTLTWKRRLEADADIVRTNMDAEHTYPKYLRMQRTGNQVSGFTSADGKLWRELAPPTTLPLGNTAVFGLAMASRNGEPSTIEFDNVQVLEGVVSVTGVESAGTNNMVLLTWLPIVASNLVGYNVYRGAKDADLAQMTLVTATPQPETFFFDNAASNTPLRNLSYAIVPVFKGTDGQSFEGPGVRAR